MQMNFEGMLLGTKAGNFVSVEGNNKGTEYKWTELQFRLQDGEIFVLRTASPLVVPETELLKNRQWTLNMQVKQTGNQVKFRVLDIMGGNGAKPK